MVPTVDAASFGRAGGVSRPSISRSFSAPKPSVPSNATVASRPGGIGGTAGSMGVRKSEPTQQAAANVNARREVTPSTVTPTTAPQVAPAPSYGYAPPPAPQVTNGSTFMSSLGGSFVGSALGNMIFGNHGSGGGSTTVINNSGSATPSAGAVTNTTGVAAPAAVVDNNGFSPMPTTVVTAKSYGIWGFIKDVILFALLIGVLVGLAYLFYKGYKMIMNFISKERGQLPSLPFSPTAKFWEIQNAFAAADLTALTALVGPDLIDGIKQNLAPSTISLYNVSHEVVMSNPSEISVHYTFVEDNVEIDQVWHYEKHSGVWVVNGIENI